MNECEHCGREFKSGAGLAKHVKSCNYKKNEDVEQETIEEQKIDISKEEMKPIVKKDLTEAEKSKYHERKKKLMAAIRQCKDAEAKHQLEVELKRTESMM